MDLSDNIKQTIYNEVQAAGHGQKTAVKNKWAEELNISLAKIHREIDFGNGKTASREPEYPDDVFHQIARVKAESEKMGANMRCLTTEDAIDVLEQAGKIPSGITRSTADRRIRKLGYYEPRSYTRHEDEHVNQYHYMDFSRSEYFEYAGMVDGQESVSVDGRRGGWSYKNKPELKRQRLWLVGYIDTFSRVALFRYFPATGEGLPMAAQFFRFAWQRHDETHPLIHLPDVLKLDQGAVGKSEAIQKNLQDRVGIRVELAAAKNNRHANHQSMGKVERQFRTMWQRMELKAAYILKQKQEKTITLDELNTLAHQYAVDRLENSHPVRSGTIGHVYRTAIRMREQRKLDTDIMDLLFKEDTRVVSAYNDITITENGVKTLYKVPEGYQMQTIKWMRNGDGQMVGSSMDGKHTFPLVAFDPEQATGQRIHKPTYREEAAANPVELDASKLKITKEKEIPSREGTVPASRQQSGEGNRGVSNGTNDLSASEGPDSVGEKPRSKPTTIHTLPASEKNIQSESPFQAKSKPIAAFTDWHACKTYICQAMDSRWKDLSEPAQDLFEELFESQKLTREIIDDIAQTAS